ncbi:MAG: DUF1080 domain-containing protein [Ktedonobacteraceae bacterium]|nr:DUF1080 domain-containing protein [Ktedonobacteraceae bacterium]
MNISNRSITSFLLLSLLSTGLLSCALATGNSSPAAQTSVATPPVVPFHTPKPDPGFHLLFNGLSTENWRLSTVKNQHGANPGRFIVVRGMLEAIAGNSLGLYWCTTPTPADFILKLDWMTSRISDNSGIFIRFPDPEKQGYANTAQAGIDDGFEVQIDQRGRPDGAAKHKTGAIYNFAGPEHADALPLHPPGQWNQFEIRVQGQTYSISLNGQPITLFHFNVGSNQQHPERGLPSSASVPRFIGLQTHPGSSPIYFRNIQIKQNT